MRRLLRRNRDGLFVGVATGGLLLVLNALVPEIPDLAAKAADPAAWLLRPTGWPPAVVILLVLVPILLVRRRG